METEKIKDEDLRALAELVGLNVIAEDLHVFCKIDGIPSIIVQGKEDPVVIGKLGGLFCRTERLFITKPWGDVYLATGELDGVPMVPMESGMWKFFINI